MSDPVGHLYEALGEDRIREMVASFYRRVPLDPILGPMYPLHDMHGAQERLADFIIFRFGGPQTYLEKRGHPRLRMRHMPFQIDPPAADQWLALMQAAINEVGIEAQHGTPMMEFFEGVAKMMINR